ncbi:MAG TPA: hypothetical protein PLP33_14870 [Leptospiraceae bacterium]|nr:hypothetical protein [Leptospiraceae bacterium]
MQQNFSLVFDQGCPQILKDILIPMFEQFHFVVPKWVEDVYVVFENDQDKNFAVAETLTDIEYRRIFLRFYPDFIYERTDKLYQFVHELVHSIYGSVYNYSHTTFSSILSGVGDEKLKEHVLDELRKYNEGSTQDLTNMLFRMLKLDKRTGKKIKNVK